MDTSFESAQNYVLHTSDDLEKEKSQWMTSSVELGSEWKKDTESLSTPQDTPEKNRVGEQKTDIETQLQLLEQLSFEELENRKLSLLEEYRTTMEFYEQQLAEIVKQEESLSDSIIFFVENMKKSLES